MRRRFACRCCALTLAAAAAVGGGSALAAPERLADPVAVARARIAQGDAAWARRAEGYRGGLAPPGPAAAAVAAFEQAIHLDPDSLEAYWKLQRSLWFQGEYATAEGAGRRRIYERGRQVSERALDLLARRVGGRRRLDALPPAKIAQALAGSEHAAQVYLGAAAHWGLWAQASGAFATVRQGALAKVRDYTLASLALDPRGQDGAGWRLLGRLYTRTPRVPLLSGWIDRDKGMTALRRGYAINPAEPTNRLFLAEAILAEHPDDREALAMLEGLLALTPRPEWLVEDSTVREQAAALLQRIKAGARR
ncbi:MAG TPA: hypothetical protein VFS60_11035 [Thermoanaerobaculia bacterium]|nr:hypothetical protein [Thermoanaerobaculia bacterium]